MLVLSFVTNLMITYMTTAGTFAFFTVITLLGAVYFAFEMENTDGLSSAQCKQVYWPEAFKQHTESLLGDGGKDQELTNVMH